MKLLHYTVATALSTVLLTGCFRSEQPSQDAAAVAPVDSSATAPVVADTQTEGESSIPDDDWFLYHHTVFQYRSGQGDSLLRTFPPFVNIYDMASRAVNEKGILYLKLQEENGGQYVDPKEHPISTDLEDKTWQAIKAYSQTATEQGLSVSGPLPKLLALTRFIETSSFNLPEGKSNFAPKGDFFFLGGAPFISKVEPEENSTVYADQEGNPEIRFSTTVSENAQYLMTWLCHLRKERFNISYGPPLYSYEYGEQEIKGYGSIKHELINRTPTLFLTEKGIVPAQLVSIAIKMFPDGRGCESDQPLLEFSCKQPIEANEILGIWIPAATAPPTTCIVKRSGNSWVADLNGDGIPDLTAVSKTFNGVSDDALYETLWFLNVNGSWEVIDWGQDMDCT